MDKYDFNIRVGQLKKLVEKEDYENALKIVDSIDWRKVSDTRLLELVAKVYEKNDVYTEAKEILLLAYEKSSYGKRFLYRLVELSVLDKNIKEAKFYYNEFEDVASKDVRKYILNYKILSLEKANIQDKIKILEKYNSEELSEEYMYELANLYIQAGEKEKAVRVLDNIILLFAKGYYVDKSFDLKLNTLNVDLNDYQVELLEKKIDLEYQNVNIDSEEVLIDNDKTDAIDKNNEVIEEVFESRQNDIAKTIKDIIFNTDDIENKDTIELETKDFVNSTQKDEKIESDLGNTKALKIESEIEELPEELQDIQNVLNEINNSSNNEELIFEEEQSFDQNNEEILLESDIKVVEEDVSEEIFLDYNNEDIKDTENIEKQDLKQNLEQDIQTYKELYQDLSLEEVEYIEDDFEKNFISGILEFVDLNDDYELAVEEAKNILKEASRLQGIDKSIVKINASKLNEKDLDDVFDKLIKKDLIIENANDLKKEHYEYIKWLIDDAVIETNIVLIVENEDEKKQDEINEEDKYLDIQEDKEIYKIYSKSEEFGFENLERNVEFLGEQLSIDDFATYASSYADEIDCVITGKSMLALYERIEIMQAKRIPLTKENARALIIETADKAEKPSFIKTIFNILTFNKKYDKDDKLILKEEHFIQ